MKALEQLNEMVGKTYDYADNRIIIMGHRLIGKSNDQVEITLGNGEKLVSTLFDLPMLLKDFAPVNSQIAVVHPEHQQLATADNELLLSLKDTLISTINQVKESKEYIPQAKQIFQGVNTVLNLARTEMEYRKFSQR